MNDFSTFPPIQPLFGISKYLVDHHLFTYEQAINVQLSAQAAQQSFVSYAVQQQLINADKLASLISQLFNIPVTDLHQYPIKDLPISTLPLNIIKQYQIIPLRSFEGVLEIAISDPSYLPAINAIKFHTKGETQLLLVREDHLQEMLQEIISQNQIASLKCQNLENSFEVDESSFLTTSDEPLINFVNSTLEKAIQKNASDIHFEPFETFFRIRFRIDGILQEIAAPSKELAPRIVTRLKIMSKLNIAEKRLPQDGRCKIKGKNRETIDVRVSTCPTLYGEKVVLRLLDNNKTSFAIQELGLLPQQEEQFLTAISKSQGLILVTGPTGSGKTVTLYAALRELNSTQRNILTVEEPVEIYLPGINQVNVLSKIGLTFATTLRAFLRQDPDIIMIGEIRDQETAEIAIKAAQTGHLVLATLHTNSASEALTRLNNLGINYYNIATSLNLILAQRLVRKLCKECKQPIINFPPTYNCFTANASETFYQAGNCQYCNRGYKGRIAIYEIIPIEQELMQLIMQPESSKQLAKAAEKYQYLSLQQVAAKKLQAGLTTIEEIQRVLG